MESKMPEQQEAKPLFRRAAFWWWLVGWLLMPFRWDVVWEQLFRRLTGG
ncbi:hypothetical protein LX76_04474 [Cereibacter changlensis]|uniref:Uncharacterized protein n=1 Tax=Cereibacter changlensis TaxID=402884 RepID=A0A2W7RAJ4_9RHOB|nr:hypothetical protein LX76_04474 [Cereibacter changlensis]